MVNTIVETLKNKTIPDSIAKIDVALDVATQKQRDELEGCLSVVSNNIKEFKERVDFFETDVAATQTKFKRLVSD